MYNALWVAAVVVCLAPVRPALAQDGAPTRRGQPNGFKIGDARLHLQADLDSRYATNPGRTSESAPSGSPSDVLVAVRPAADLDMAGALLELKLKGNFEYQRYLGLENEATAELSTYLYEGGVDAVFNKSGPLTLRVVDNLRRSADPGQSVTTRLLHVSNELGTDLEMTPGGGALIFGAGYGFIYDYYDRGQEAVADPAALDNMKHVPRLKATWKFLPKTSLFCEASGTFAVYPVKGEIGDPATGTFRNEDSTIVKAALGASGAVTAKISMVLKAGYSGYFGSDSSHSPSGQVEVRYNLSETSKIIVGYQRDKQPVHLYRHVTMDRGTLGYNQAIAGRLQVTADVGYTYLSFGKPAGAPAARHDHTIAAALTLDAQITELLIVSLADNFTLLESDFQGPEGQSASYSNNELNLRISVRY